MSTNAKTSQPFGLRFLSTHSKSVRTGVKAGALSAFPAPSHGAVSCDIARLDSGALIAAT